MMLAEITVVLVVARAVEGLARSIRQALVARPTVVARRRQAGVEQLAVGSIKPGNYAVRITVT